MEMTELVESADRPKPNMNPRNDGKRMKRKTLTTLIIAALAACLSFQPFGTLKATAQNTKPASKETSEEIKKLLSKATAICLVEITEMKERDSRPVDGNLEVEVSYKLLKSTGDPPKMISLVKEFGGLRPRGSNPKLPEKFNYKKIAVGEKHWLVFGKGLSEPGYPFGILRWWPEKSQRVPNLIFEAVGQQEEESKENKNKESEEKIAELLKKSQGAALVEIIDVAEKDGRPYDANYTVTIRFKKLKSRGEVPDSITMIKAYGGRRAGPPPALPTVLRPDMLKKGDKHWFIFSKEYNRKKYPPMILRWWPENSKSIPDVLKKSVKDVK